MIHGSFLLWIGLAAGAERFGGHRFYFGDPHVHTAASGDGGSTDLGVCQGSCGAVEALAETAKAHGLDWLAVTDHVNGQHAASAADFAWVHEQVLAQHRPEEGFVTLPGAELWFEDPDGSLGHKNLYLGADNETLASLRIEGVRFDGDREMVDDCASIWSWVEQVEANWGPVALIPHHPGMPVGMGTAWRCHQDGRAGALGPSVEVYSRHGNSVRCPSGWDPLWSGCYADRAVTAALDPEHYGLRLGFLGGTDAHDTLPGNVCAHDTEMPNHPYGGGLSVAVLPEGERFDRDTLLEAIQQGRTYASSGPLLPVLVSYWAGGSLLGGMGDRLPLPPDEPLQVLLRVPPDRAEAIVEVTLQSSRGKLSMRRGALGAYHAEIPPEAVPPWLFPLVVLDGTALHDPPCEDAGDDHAERIWLSPSFPIQEWSDSASPGDSDPSYDSAPTGDSLPRDREPRPEGRCTGCGWGGAGSTVSLLLGLLALPWGLRRRQGEPSG
jgi:hypothetical protein